MRKIFYLVMIISVNAFAGTGSGGGTPPGKDPRNDTLMAKLLESGSDFGLLINSDLTPKLLINKGTDISERDFDLIRDRFKLDAVNFEGIKASYKVQAGAELNSLLLKDRRQLMRESIQ